MLNLMTDSTLLYDDGVLVTAAFEPRKHSAAARSPDEPSLRLTKINKFTFIRIRG